MSRVLCSQGHPFQDEISDIKLSWLYQCVMVLSYQVLVMCHPLFCIHPYLVNKIKAWSKLFLILLSVIVATF